MPQRHPDFDPTPQLTQDMREYVGLDPNATVDDNGPTALATEPPTFLFNDYFSDPDDKGLEVTVLSKQRYIPFRIKRVLTLKEKQAASDAAVKIDFDVKGQPVLKKVDQGAYTVEIVLAGLKYWPYEYVPGKPVPITRATVAAHDSAINDQLAALILGIAEVQQQALAPFEMKSDEA